MRYDSEITEDGYPWTISKSICKKANLGWEVGLARKLVKSHARKTRSAAGRPKGSAPPLPKIVSAQGTSVERQVYGAIRFALMSGAIQPGARLTIRSLSEELGVSPTPVREALKRLEADGAVTGRNKSAFVVYDPDKVDFEELFEIRLALECQAIRRAAKKARRDDINLLRRMTEDYHKILTGKERSVQRALSENFRFHFEVYRLSGSTMLVELIETLWLRIGPTLQRYMPSHGNISFHNKMIDALAMNQPDLAADALRDDLTAAHDVIVAQLPDRS
ncbi:hypothetical protein QV13_07400 [Mesorhizobium hungaricum]|jgi:DNA-binding GntR family transcriptional regulator|uniref:HTH gntR-type domain-containing protein n=1 Tax=Mesorhizobium hungaricum TaxID=1566387 RepID=A0A1C2E3H9_9HYPH|nr:MULTISPECIES: GntR family transcriptional regulator [Mesorhizobium]MBN9235812.1 GntR family transcriptional regulator [Mesorhizobium sp.]MDQ0333094.1 DNA-binding GntR family transcriptional regulator [Mesorhizobium sp. YL-MeA3-2017]OCX21473.1 hypothetical protein QV13_07400 [Mesorhizobium hungaricum]